DQRDDERERVEPGGVPPRPEVDGEIGEDQGKAAVEDAARAVGPRVDLVPQPVAPEHVGNDRDRKEEDDLQEQREREQRPLEIEDEDDRRDRQDDDESAYGP